MNKYRLSEEDTILLPKWRDEVIAKMNSTAPMSDDDRAVSEKAIYKLKWYIDGEGTGRQGKTVWITKW